MGGYQQLPVTPFRPVQTDPVEQYGNLLRLKGVLAQQALIPGQMQLQQEQLKQAHIATQQAEQDQQDRQAFRTALQDPAMHGKNLSDIAETLASKGAISPSGYANFKKLDLDQRETLAGINEKDLANLKAAHDQTQTLYNNAMNMDDASLAQNWSSIAQQYDAIPGNNKMPLDPNQPMTKAQLAQFGPMLSMGNTYFDQELARREKLAQTKKAEQEVQFGPTGPAADAKYDNIVSRLLNHQSVTPEEYQWAQGHRAGNMKQTTTSDSLGVTSTSQSGPSALPALNGMRGGGSGASSGGATQGTKESLVDTIGQYKMDPALLGRAIYRHPELLGMIHDKYPDWDQTSYNAKNNIVKSYTSGPESKSINAISTALGHAGELGQAIDALNNSNGMNFLRSLANKYNVSVSGDDKITTFNTIVHRLGPEIAAAYIQGGGGEGERVANEKDFDAELGNNQLRSNLGITIKLLRSKIAAQEQQWNNTYKPTQPSDNFETRFLTPGAKAALEKYAPESGRNNGNQPQTKTGNSKVDSLLSKHGF